MTALVTGLFVLAGVLVGAYLNRRTVHQKWLYERRSETYAEFLGRLEESFEAVKPLSHLNDGSMAGASEVRPAFSSMLSYVNIVRLYLSPDSRDEFSNLAEGIFEAYVQSAKDSGAYGKIRANKENIQRIFEQSLIEQNMSSIFDHLFTAVRRLIFVKQRTRQK